MDLFSSVFDSTGSVESKFGLEGRMHSKHHPTANDFLEAFTDQINAALNFPSESSVSLPESYFLSNFIKNNPVSENTPFSSEWLEDLSSQDLVAHKTLSAWLISQGFATDGITSKAELTSQPVDEAAFFDIAKRGQDNEVVSNVAEAIKPMHVELSEEKTLDTIMVMPSEKTAKAEQPTVDGYKSDVLKLNTSELFSLDINHQGLTSERTEPTLSIEQNKIFESLDKAERNLSLISGDITQNQSGVDFVHQDLVNQGENLINLMDVDKFVSIVTQSSEEERLFNLTSESGLNTEKGFSETVLYQLSENDAWGLNGRAVSVPYSQAFWVHLNSSNAEKSLSIGSNRGIPMFLSNLVLNNEKPIEGVFKDLVMVPGLDRPTTMQQNQILQIQSFVKQAFRDEIVLDQQRVLKESDIKSDLTKEAWGSLGETTLKAERSMTGPTLASVQYPLNHGKWAQAIGKRILFMANHQMQQAQISLNPEKLGPIQLRLQFDRDQLLTVSMTAQHAMTREALDAAIPRLKEMLSEAGIDFDAIEVNEDAMFGEGDGQQNLNHGNHSGKVDEAKAEDLMAELESDNLIDFYV